MRLELNAQGISTDSHAFLSHLKSAEAATIYAFAFCAGAVAKQ